MSHLGERLSALIDGELSHGQRDRVLAHLARCDACRREAVALRALKQRMRTLGEATAGDSLTDRLMALTVSPGVPPARARPGQSLPRWPARSLALTALVVLALGLPAVAFLAGGRQQQPGPSVTPAVDMFITQQAVNNGAVPARPGREPSPSDGDRQQATGAPAGGGAAVHPAATPTAGGPATAGPVLRRRARGATAASAPSGPPTRRASGAPGGVRSSGGRAARRTAAPGAG